jgi:hypothetical protein
MDAAFANVRKRSGATGREGRFEQVYGLGSGGPARASEQNEARDDYGAPTAEGCEDTHGLRLLRVEATRGETLL